jgi:serine/threonine-protein kinase
MDTKVADPLRGALLGGRYRIMGRLARGGMATVYQARDERLERPVAVKIIHSDHVLDEEILDRLAAEAKTGGPARPPEHRRGVRPGHPRGRALRRHGVRARPHAA